MASIMRALLAALLLLPMVRTQEHLLHDQPEPQAPLSPHPKEPLSSGCPQPSQYLHWAIQHR